MTNAIIWMPAKSLDLDPYSNGQYVPETFENKAEAKKRWEEHHQKYFELANKKRATAQTLENRDIKRQ